MPRIIRCVDSVTIKAGTFVKPTIKPLKRPRTILSASAISVEARKLIPFTMQ